MKQYEPHPFAEIFPLHEGPLLWELSDDIKKNGQKEDVVLYENKVLDGRRRELGCIRHGIKPTYRQFGSRKSDGTDPLEFVMSVNLHRRHLGEAERAMAAAAYAKAKVGNPDLTKKSQKTLAKVGTSQSVQLEPIGLTNDEAAEKFDVTKTDIKRAKKVLASGTSALKEAVGDETISLSDAANVSGLPQEKQDEAIQKVKAGKAKSVTAAANEHDPETPLTDAHGTPIPDAAKEAFANLARFEELDSLCRKLQAGISEMASLAGGEHLARCLQATRSGDKTIYKSEHLNNLKRDIRFTRPHGVCPYCEIGKPGCKGCNGMGWVGKVTFDNGIEATKGKAS